MHDRQEVEHREYMQIKRELEDPTYKGIFVVRVTTYNDINV